MKKLILSISILAFIGCGKSYTERKKEDLPNNISTLKVKDCEYVFWHNGRGSDMEHYAGCSNPAHK